MFGYDTPLSLFFLVKRVDERVGRRLPGGVPPTAAVAAVQERVRRGAPAAPLAPEQKEGGLWKGIGNAPDHETYHFYLNPNYCKFYASSEQELSPDGARRGVKFVYWRAFPLTSHKPRGLKVQAAYSKGFLG